MTEERKRINFVRLKMCKESSILLLKLIKFKVPQILRWLQLQEDKGSTNRFNEGRIMLYENHAWGMP